MIIITNNKNDNNNGFIVIHTKYFVIFLLAQIPPTKSLHIQLALTKFGRRERWYIVLAASLLGISLSIVQSLRAR